MLVLSLIKGKAVLEAEASLVGLRKVEIRDRQLQVNRKPIMIKGANRHEHDEQLGKYTDLAGMLLDIPNKQRKGLKLLVYEALSC